LKEKIAITALSSVSALGCESNSIWNQYLAPETLIKTNTIGNNEVFTASIPDEVKQEVLSIKNEDNKYKALDQTVLMALFVARKALKNAHWNTEIDFGINFGSSRGATQLFEQHYETFLKTGKTPTLTSPTTTLGNISSWVAHDLKSKGIAISHSITCSTSLHAIVNGIAWLQSGMAQKFMAGGSEAPLTAFTIQQMQSLKIYAQQSATYPCKALQLDKTKNTMVLGEGAAVVCMENGENPNALAYITGIGFATDTLQHNISISEDAKCFQESMKMAIKNCDLHDIDAIVMHAPGTIKGDSSEVKAIEQVFGNHKPLLTTNKWKIGHTFGASGILSLELAILMLQHNQFISVPYLENQTVNPKPLRNILVNAVGFGGNAVTLLVSKA
jgi:3-oxoacyl-[acyl-carrier-protein] synthase II